MFVSRKPGLKYVERTGLTGWDWSIGSFTADGALHNFDLSSILPANAKMVHLRAQVVASAAGRAFRFTSVDDTGFYGLIGPGTVVGNIAHESDVFVKTDSTGIIQYYLYKPGVLSCELNVIGWMV